MDNIGIIETKYKSCASLAIQCLKEAGIADREDAFKHHIQNAKTLGLMPDDFKVIKVTIADYGFVMQSSRLENAYFSDVVSALGTSISTPSTVLITIRDYMHMGGYMVSLKTDGAHSFRFTCPDPRLQNIGRETVTHVWIRWDDLIDRSPFPRKSVNRHTASPKRREVKNTDSFHFFNPNPCSNFIGDCVVRAASGAMDISWSEAMDRLASVGETTVNARDVYPKVLEIDYNGMVQVRDYFRNSDISVTTVFICTEGNELFNRLYKRGDSPIEIKKRLTVARSEASHVGEFDCLINNGDLKDAAHYLWMVVTRETDFVRNSFDSLLFIEQVDSVLRSFDYNGSVEEA